MERDVQFQILLLHIAQSPGKKKSLLIKQSLTFFSESQVKELPYMFP